MYNYMLKYNYVNVNNKLILCKSKLYIYIFILSAIRLVIVF